MRLAGICGTDRHLVRGDFPGIEPGAVVGHEFVREVVDSSGVAENRLELGGPLRLFAVRWGAIPGGVSDRLVSSV